VSSCDWKIVIRKGLGSLEGLGSLDFPSLPSFSCFPSLFYIKKMRSRRILLTPCPARTACRPSADADVLLLADPMALGCAAGLVGVHDACLNGVQLRPISCSGHLGLLFHVDLCWGQAPLVLRTSLMGRPSTPVTHIKSIT